MVVEEVENIAQRRGSGGTWTTCTPLGRLGAGRCRGVRPGSGPARTWRAGGIPAMGLGARPARPVAEPSCDEPPAGGGIGLRGRTGHAAGVGAHLARGGPRSPPPTGHAESYLPHWRRWAASEQALFDRDGTRIRADLILNTSPSSMVGHDGPYGTGGHDGCGDCVDAETDRSHARRTGRPGAAHRARSVATEGCSPLAQGCPRRRAEPPVDHRGCVGSSLGLGEPTVAYYADRLYAGAKASLRPLHDGVIALAVGPTRWLHLDADSDENDMRSLEPLLRAAAERLTT